MALQRAGITWPFFSKQKLGNNEFTHNQHTEGFIEAGQSLFKNQTALIKYSL
jgi:hypothetical protein